MNEAERKVQIEINLTLQRVVRDLEHLEALREKVSDIPTMARKLEEVYHTIFIGDGDGNMSIMQRLVLLENRKPRRSFSAKERVALLSLFLGVVGAIAKAYSDAR